MNSDLLVFLGTLGFSWLITIVALAFTPYYTRRSISFGIAVPQEQYHSEFFTVLRRQYLLINLIVGGLLALVSVLAVLYLSEEVFVWVFFVTLLLYIALAFFWYARSHQKVRDYKRNSDWIVTDVVSARVIDREDTRKPFNLWWYMTHLAFVAAIVIMTWIRYPKLPARIPQNYDLSGQATLYTSKSWGSMLMLPMLMLIMSVIFFGVSWGANRSKRQTDDRNVKRGLHNDRTFQILMSRSMFWLGLGAELTMAGVQLAMIRLASPSIILWFSLVFIVVTIVLVVYLTLAVGQGGYRLAPEGLPASGRTAHPDIAGDDSKWRFFGTFYDDPDDPSIFVEKRFGVGWTTNIGNPKGKALIIGTLIIIAVMTVLPFLIPAK